MANGESDGHVSDDATVTPKAQVMTPIRLESGRLKMREWKMRYGQKCKGGKCRSSLSVWTAEPRLYRDTALRYFMKNVLRRLNE